MSTWFFFSEVWFWLILAGIVIETICVAKENSFLATASLLVFLLALQFGAKVNVGSYIVTHWQWVLIGCGTYFVVGPIWSFVKWYLFLLDARDVRDAKKAEFFASSSPRVDEAAWLKFIGNQFPPKAKEHREKIVCWIAFWPFSALWTALDDVVERIAKIIFNMFSGWYQSLSNHVFRVK
jgi:hypothetical protein